MSTSSRSKLPTKKVSERYQVADRTIARWQDDPALAFPAPMVVNGRKYWDEDELIAWERARAAPKVA
jgi:hypothetical protein